VVTLLPLDKKPTGLLLFPIQLEFTKMDNKYVKVQHPEKLKKEDNLGLVDQIGTMMPIILVLLVALKYWTEQLVKITSEATYITLVH
jgi:hypothetical protein